MELRQFRNFLWCLGWRWRDRRRCLECYLCRLLKFLKIEVHHSTIHIIFSIVLYLDPNPLLISLLKSFFHLIQLDFHISLIPLPFLRYGSLWAHRAAIRAVAGAGASLHKVCREDKSAIIVSSWWWIKGQLVLFDSNWHKYWWIFIKSVFLYFSCFRRSALIIYRLLS